MRPARHSFESRESAILHYIVEVYLTFTLSLIRTTGRNDKPAESSPLLVPVGFGGDGADLTLGYRRPTAEVRLQEEQFFLQIRGEVAEVHDLAEASSCDLAGSR